MFNTILVLHFIGWITLIAGVVGYRWNHSTKLLLPGALISMISGFALMFIPNAEGYASGFTAQLGVKIALTVIITVLAGYGVSLVAKQSNQNADGAVAGSGGSSTLAAVAPWVNWAIGGITLVTMAIAFLWR